MEEDSSKVLVYGVDGYEIYNTWYLHMHHNFTHWMPLPTTLAKVRNKIGGPL